MTLEAATAAFNEQLGKFLDNPQASVEVFAYNSKVYYVITEVAPTEHGGTRPDHWQRDGFGRDLPGRRPDAAVEQEHLDRAPTPGGSGCDVVLPVNLREITKGAVTTTNYQVLPGDRIFVSNRMSRQAAQKY